MCLCVCVVCAEGSAGVKLGLERGRSNGDCMKETGRWQDYRSGVSGWRRLCMDWQSSSPVRAQGDHSPSNRNAGTRSVGRGGGELFHLVLGSLRPSGRRSDAHPHESAAWFLAGCKQSTCTDCPCVWLRETCAFSAAHGQKLIVFCSWQLKVKTG